MHTSYGGEKGGLHSIWQHIPELIQWDEEEEEEEENN